ncbi:MAG: hypothetical protein E6Y40_11485 [Klebsiella oxytoca]|nr:hypothetical protein [Klebsiella oxytoca]
MTDITELAQREKFEAWWEREYKHLESSKYTDAVPHIKYGFWMAFQAGGAELVEALELKEDQRSNWFQMAQKLGEDLDAAKKRNDELEREHENLRPVGVMSEKAYHRLENRESRFIALWPRPEIYLPRKRPEDGVIVYARTSFVAAN